MMGEPQSQSPPRWFVRYMEEASHKAEEAGELERLRTQSAKALADEERSRLIRNNTKPGKALPPLLEYHGESERLEAWLQQARAKLEVDFYGCTEFVKFWALNGSLRGKALRRMEVWVREQGTPYLANADSFLQRLDFLFRDPQAKERAQRKLEVLRQGSRSFLEVFTEWQSLLMESGGGCWPDDAKKISLDRILNDDLSRAMITVPSQTDFELYCSALKELDEKLRAYKSRIGASRRSEYNRPGIEQPTRTHYRPPIPFTDATQVETVQKPAVDPMDWQPTPATIMSTRTQRAKWVTQGELDERRRSGYCFRCGASTHRVRNCPYQPARRPASTNTVRNERKPELEEDQDRDTNNEAVLGESEN